MRRRKTNYPDKRSMNLYYKPDRTTRPATAALYVTFVLVCLLGLGKLLVYDVWMDTVQARASFAAAEQELNGVMQELSDYPEVRSEYSRYSATDEELSLIDRMEILDLLDNTVGVTAAMDTVVIRGNTVQIQFSAVSLAQTARIVEALDASPIVESTTVNTASTTENTSDLVQASILIQLQKEAAE